jgi:hypothetical protein
MTAHKMPFYMAGSFTNLIGFYYLGGNTIPGKKAGIGNDLGQKCFMGMNEADRHAARKIRVSGFPVTGYRFQVARDKKHEVGGLKSENRQLTISNWQGFAA